MQIGTDDTRILDQLGETAPLPLNIPLLLSTYSQIQAVLNTHINGFGLDTNYVLRGAPGKFAMEKYSGSAGPQNIFDFVLVKGLGHNYPNGKNHPMEGAKFHWEWMKDFRR